jgi:hypothetical protein
VTDESALSMTDESGVTARPKRFRGKTKALSLLAVAVKSALAVTDESDKRALAVTVLLSRRCCLGADVCDCKSAFV